MKKIKTLSLIFGSGGSGGGYGDGLTPAEHLFGPGIGTGQTPTHIVSREDGAGFEVLSFGAWGNVYDLKKTNGSVFGGWSSGNNIKNNNIELYDFLAQRRLDVQQNYKSEVDASVANSTFVGAAIMYAWHAGNGLIADGSDYGTMKLQFGEDIGSARLEFVMSNPDNNLITMVSGTEHSDGFDSKFTTDRKNVSVKYRTSFDATYGKTYIGYGSKK